MRSHTLAFIDLETTGFDPEQNEIIEIGLVLVEQSLDSKEGIKLNVLEEFETKVKPTHIETADPVSLNISHYNPADWIFAADIKDAMRVLAEKTVNATMVGHNVAFDSSFLEVNFSRTGIKNTMHYHRIDTISIAFAKLYRNEDVEKLSLRSLCEYLNVKNAKAHSALSDARATFEVFEKLMKL